jgi:adenine deaminase
MNMWFGASSCVPASPLETAGANLEADDLQPLFDDDRIIALAEMMNFPGVVHAVPSVLDKVRLGLERRLVDGHCPGLSGRALQAYVAAGISSDHECTTAEEALEKLGLGMRIYLREGSAAKNLEALLPAVTPETAHRFSFCTDDRHPGDIVEEGHIDHVIRKAIALGLDPVTAIAMGSRHTAEHYGQFEHGAIAPGCFADLIVLDDLREISCRQVYYHGRLIADSGRLVDETPAAPIDTSGVTGTVHLPDDFGEGSLTSAAGSGGLIRVIGMDPHQLVTTELQLEPRIDDGQYVADTDRDVLKLAVIERHRGAGNVGIGFVQGFGLERGAIASTVGHDAHNLIVVGTNDRDMAAAARALAEVGGGQCAANDGAALAVLPLPIAGLLSDAAVPTLVEQQQMLAEASRQLGCELHDPFMPLSFMSLSVIPKLKLSDRGLVDVDKFDFVPLEV